MAKQKAKASGAKKPPEPPQKGAAPPEKASASAKPASGASAKGAKPASGAKGASAKPAKGAGAKPASGASAKPASGASAKPASGASNAKPAKNAKPTKSAPKALSAEERQRLIKPADGYTEIAETFITTWGENKALKVPSATPAKLSSALKRAKKAAAREEAFKRKLEEKLRPLQDARLQAEHDVWKMVLDVYAVARAQARVAPELGRAFAFVGESLAKRARGKKPAPAAAPGPPEAPKSPDAS